MCIIDRINIDFNFMSAEKDWASVFRAAKPVSYTHLDVYKRQAVDKAILYGKNVKMPMGIVTSILLEEAPDEYPTTAREWEDLRTSHVITGKTATGLGLFQDIVTCLLYTSRCV